MISLISISADRTVNHQLPETSQRRTRPRRNAEEEEHYTRHHTRPHSYNTQTATLNCSRYWIHEQQIRHTCASCEASQGSSPFGQGSFIYPSYTGPGPPGVYRYLENPFYQIDHRCHSNCVHKSHCHSGQRSCSTAVWSRSHSTAVRHPRSFSRQVFPSGFHQPHFVNTPTFHHPFPSTFATSNFRGHGNSICSPTFVHTGSYHCESDPEYSMGNLREASNHATCGSCSSESLPSLDKICIPSLGKDNSREGKSFLCDINDSNHSTCGSRENRLHSDSSMESNLADFTELRDHVVKTFNAVAPRRAKTPWSFGPSECNRVSKALKKHQEIISGSSKNQKQHLSHSSSISSCDSNTFHEICKQQSANLEAFLSDSSGKGKMIPSSSTQKVPRFNDAGTSMTPDFGSKINIVANLMDELAVSKETDDLLNDTMHSDSDFSSCQNCDQWATDSSSLSLSSFHSDIKPSSSSSSLSLSDIRSSCGSSLTDSSGLSLSDISGLSVYLSEESLLSSTSQFIANANLPVRESGASYLGLVSQYTCKACDRTRSVIKSTRLAHRCAPYHNPRLSLHDCLYRYHKHSIASDCHLNCRRRRNITSHCGYYYKTGANRKQYAFMDCSNIKELLLWIRNFKYRDKCCSCRDCSCKKEYQITEGSSLKKEYNTMESRSAVALKLQKSHSRSERTAEYSGILNPLALRMARTPFPWEWSSDHSECNTESNLNSAMNNYTYDSYSAKIDGASSLVERTPLLNPDKRNDCGTISSSANREIIDTTLTEGNTIDPGSRQQCRDFNQDQESTGSSSTETTFSGTTFCVACGQQLSGQSDPTHRVCRSMVVFTEPQGEYFEAQCLS